MKTIIFDLDGTLADIDHRLHFIRGQKKRWHEFFQASIHDSPIPPIIELCNVLYAAAYRIRIFTGRSEAVREGTIEWLHKHGVQYNSLTMRAEGNFTPDHELKAVWLEQILSEGEQILCAFDDRDQVVEMWRRRGLTCLQVAEGEF